MLSHQNREKKMEEKKTQKVKVGKEAKGKGRQAENLGRQIEQLQKEKDELFAQLQRVSADYSNFQKRSPKQIVDSVAYEKEKIIKTFLPALDNFEHTLQGASGANDIDILIKGVKIVYDQMLDILKSHGIEQIMASGEKFDPSVHQAMMQRSEPAKAEGIVLEEFQKGYKLNGRVIRPSKVIVNKAQAEAEEGAGAEAEGEDKE